MTYCCIGSKVEEELAKNVKCQEAIRWEMMVCKADDDEKDSQDNESHQLNRLATNGIDSGDSDPVKDE